LNDVEIQKASLSYFFTISGTVRTSELIRQNYWEMEIKQDNLQMKFAAQDVDFNRLSHDLFSSRSLPHGVQ